MKREIKEPEPSVDTERRALLTPDIHPRKKKSENVHKAHRQRMRTRFVRTGADGFFDHELLEMLLYYCTPQKDTNELAHALLERFGSLAGVLQASPEEIQSVPGIKEYGSVLIRLTGEIARRCHMEQARPITRFTSVEQIGEYLVHLFHGVEVERLYLLLFDNGMRLIDCILVSEGVTNAVGVNIRKIAQAALVQKASCVVIAHNHPGGVALPSRADLSLTREIDAALAIFGIRFLEHFVVAGERYNTLLHADGRENFGNETYF